MGAGILPMTIHRNNIYFLFSRENINYKKYDGGKWSDFGGSKERNETFYETAVREGFEESDGFLGTKEDIKRLLKNNFVKTITLPNMYRTYIVYIPYDNTLPKRFRTKFLSIKKNNPELIGNNGLFEKDMLKWVRIDKLNDFKSEVRPWYKKIVNLIIKYGIKYNAE